MRHRVKHDTDHTRRTLALLALTFALLAIGQIAHAGGKPRSVCAPGFDLGALTFEQALQLPNTQAGLAAGVYDEAILAQAFDSIDANDDDVICFQSIPASGTTPNPASGWQFFNNTVDNNASVPSG